MDNVGSEFSLSSEQEGAIAEIEDWFFNRKPKSKNTFYLAGYAGSGKTTITREIIRRLGLDDSNSRACALTAKASRVLKRKIGLSTTTLHQLCYRFIPNKELEKAQKRLSDLYASGRAGEARRARAEIDEMAEGGGGRFVRRDPTELAGTNLIIADECFDYDQKILTEHGWERIGTVVNTRKQTRVWARNPDTGNLELKPIVRWLKNPLRDVMVRINAGRSDSLRNARIIRCTTTHKILTPSGYVRAGDLREGDALIVRGRSLTREQLDVVVGSLFGDGSLTTGASRSSPQFKITHGEEQLSYLQAKKDVFVNLAGAGGVGRSGYTGKPVHYMTVDTVDQIYDLKSMMLPGGRGRGGWSPDDRLVEMLTPHAIAVWYLDNGSVDVRNLTDGSVSMFARIATNRFTEEDCLRLAEHLRTRFGLAAKVQADGDRGWILSFGKESTNSLFDLIQNYVPACMAHKVPGRDCRWVATGTPASDTCEAKIRHIETYVPSRNHVYDIEVEDHHNYVAGNIVVSNCSMLTSRHIDDLARFKVPTLFIGDPGQLDPILAGEDKDQKPFSHIFKSPNVFLEQVHRQGEDSDILDVATKVRRGEGVNPRKMTNNVGKYRTTALDSHPAILDWADVLLCHRHVTRRMLNRKIRERSGFTSPLPQEGETVVCRLNNHELGIARGEQYHVCSDAVDEGGGSQYCWLDLQDEDGNVIDVRADRRMFDAYDDPELCEDVDKGRINFSKKMPPFDFGYALTVHSAQGSEWEKVLVYDDFAAAWKADEYNRWSYTAVTRASKELLILY